MEKSQDKIIVHAFSTPSSLVQQVREEAARADETISRYIRIALRERLQRTMATQESTIE